MTARLVWRCDACHYQESGDAEQLAVRLQSLGMLKRERKADLALLLELGSAAADRWNCPDCGEAGFRPELAPEEDDWGQPRKRCAACGAAIPRERVDLFPESDLCAACQGKIDAGGSPDQHDDYCPRCGTRMIVRQGRGAGLSRYEMSCPVCRR